ncbi:probable G-protein coupled receptor No18 [Dendronephthya gigantea]|uniref:probable G-protein coupled receptor No18 n=1 Tax=Dendronephthya gigantea TaxID=151771 RepID=UPI00106C5093|nr:probable G-protein coupled receptor No18 [Dendronephthya gigantea]
MLDTLCNSNMTSQSQAESYATAILSGLLALVTIPGNVLVCLAVLKTSNRNIRNPFNYFVLSLAVADLVVGCLTEPLSVYVHVKEASGGRVEHVELEFLHMSYFISCTSSVLSICLLGIERYVAITSPLKFRLFFSVRRFLLLGTILWLTSIGLSSIYLVTNYTTYALIFSTNAVGWTLGVSIFTYTKILRTFNERLRNSAIQRRKKTTMSSETKSQSANVGLQPVNRHHRSPSKQPLSPAVVPKHKSRLSPSPATHDGNESKSKTHHDAKGMIPMTKSKKNDSLPNPWNVKLTKTYLVIISIFLACYFPACVVIYTMKWCSTCSCETLRYLQDLQFMIIAVQSALNPFVYAFRFKRFRNAVMQMLHCRPRTRANVRSTVNFKSNMALTKSTLSLQVSAIKKHSSEEL